MDTHIEFTGHPICPPALPAHFRETGAEVEFRGIVRETEDGAPIAGLQYEAHVPMAELHLRRILSQLREALPCQAVWFIHRLGWVPVGEASLFIRVLAAHREPAFQFSMALIDLMKQDVPIWKVTPQAAGVAGASPLGSR